MTKEIREVLPIVVRATVFAAVLSWGVHLVHFSFGVREGLIVRIIIFSGIFFSWSKEFPKAEKYIWPFYSSAVIYSFWPEIDAWFERTTLGIPTSGEEAMFWGVKYLAVFVLVVAGMYRVSRDYYIGRLGE